MTQARSFLADQTWAAATHADRVAWFNQYGDRIARARGAFVIAAEAYAKEVQALGANERHNFRVNDFISDALDATDAFLAEEVRDWLES